MRPWTNIGLTICSMLIALAAATQPSALTAASTVDQILDALDARGQNLADFSASVKLADENDATGDATISSGKLLFQRTPDGDTRIRIAFDKKQLDEKVFDQNHTYTLDAGWLTERDYDQRREIRQQVLKPGEKLDLFKLGKGPFPLPIGQKKEDVENIFDVTKVDPAKDDPPSSVHLRLTPKSGTQYAHDFSTVDVWVDLTTAMPVRIQTLDANQTTVKTTDFSSVKLNAGLSDADFHEPPLPSGWDEVTEPYDQQ
jgi:outer membrane lipoprotein-sorting protein